MNAPLTPATVAPLHPVRKACIEAATKLVNLQPTKIVGEPDMRDATALIGDLDALCLIIDPIVAAIGDYAQSHFGRIDRTLFTDQLHNALDGNATFEIGQAARAMIRDRAEAAE